MDAVNNYSYNGVENNNKRTNSNENQAQADSVSEHEEQGNTVQSGEEAVDEPLLIQSVDGDETGVNATDIYIFGDENQSVAVMKSDELVSESKIKAANVQLTPSIHVYNADIYDKHDRQTLTRTGAKVTLYEDKVIDEETGEEKVHNDLSAYYEYQQIHHYGLEPEIVYGIDYTRDSSSVKRKISTDVKALKKEDQIGKIEINSEWKKNEGLQKISFGSEVGNGTILKLGKDGEYKTVAITHEKKSANHDNNIQEEVQLSYMDKKNYSILYSVDNKGITKWGLSAKKQDGENRFGIFFNKPL